MEQVEKILWRDKPLAYVIRGDILPKTTTFFTPPELTQQVGYIVYSAGEHIKRHVHRPLERNLVGAAEVVIVRRGHCSVDIYNDNRELVESCELHEGDIVLLICGGHGFRMQEDTVLLEVKQGPYIGIEEKEYF